ncbi:MAG TPA: ABC transporter permease [Chloroflexota bacterium]|nr:ABC transporter permease [Chloroflexota bacterium]
MNDLPPGPAVMADQGVPRRKLPPALSRLRGRLRDPIGMIGVVIIVCTVLAAVLGPVIWRIDYASEAYGRLTAPSLSHPMGTDELGRDVLSRVLHGAQVSLEIGIISVGIALVLGTAAALAAVFYGTVVDAVLMRLVDILFAFPGLILAILIAGLLGPSRTHTMMAIGLVYAPAFARVARASAMETMAQPFVEAVRSLGATQTRLMIRHVVPQLLSPLIVLSTIYLSTAILTEASLSYIGLGTQPPEPSWGSMLFAAETYMQLAPWLAIFPGLAIMITILGFNFIGDWLRDVLDPRMGVPL